MTASVKISSTEAFAQARPRLFGLAYRMLGSAAEAEDVVQDAWLRWQGSATEEVLDATGFLVTTTTRLALNVLGSARIRRESYVGPWLPEPVDTSSDPFLGAERGEALELAVLVLLEKLPATERAAYILREAFEYEYERIAAILETREDNARQWVTRARKHLAEQRRTPVSAAEQTRLLEAFLVAARQGDRASLETLLATDVISLTDGNGVANASRVPVAGRTRVAKFVAGFASHFWTDVTWSKRTVNGATGFAVSRDGAVFVVVAVDASSDGIERIWWIMSPPKLARVAHV